MRLLHLLPHTWTQPDGEPYAIYWSDTWGLGRLYPVPSASQLDALYATPEYTDYAVHGPGHGGHGRAPKRVSIAERALFRLARLRNDGHDLDASHLEALVHDLDRKGRFCDVGCGPALLLASLRERGHEVLGIEPSPIARASAAEHGVRVLDGTAEHLPDDAPRDHFDVVTMVQSLEHCSDVLLAIRNAALLLRPGGTMVCEVPNHESLGFAQKGPAWFHTDAGRHIHFFSDRSLRRATELAGLSHVRTEYAGYSRQYAWLPAEREVWDRLYGAESAGAPAAAPSNGGERREHRDGTKRPSSVPPPRPTVGRQWRLLARTLAGPEGRAYDSVRVYAQKPR